MMSAPRRRLDTLRNQSPIERSRRMQQVVRLLRENPTARSIPGSGRLLELVGGQMSIPIEPTDVPKYSEHPDTPHYYADTDRPPEPIEAAGQQPSSSPDLPSGIAA